MMFVNTKTTQKHDANTVYVLSARRRMSSERSLIAVIMGATRAGDNRRLPAGTLSSPPAM
jgi:hypothetical protein